MGKLSFYYGVMGSGKSEELMKIYRNYERVGIEPLVYNFSGDEERHFGELDAFGVVSRNTDWIHAKPFNQETVFGNELLIPAGVVLIDEGQFMTRNQVLELADLVDTFGIDVLVFGLKTDFQGNFFNGSETLIQLADKLIELKTLCAKCTHKAVLNGRFVNGEQVYDGAQVLIGDEDYKGLCRKHWFENMVD